ncbi:hypothetical protein ACIBRY_25745 [Streptomyces anulatus]
MTVIYAFGTWSQQQGQPGMSIRFESEISKEEFESCVDSISAFESLMDRGAFSLMSRSHSNIKMMVAAFSNAEKYGGTFRGADKKSIMSSLMAELTNWLAATRLYLENERDFILTNFGAASPEMEEFKAAISKSFDLHEGYRFLYNLRDYTQHCGIPAGHLNVSGIPPNRIVEVTLDKSRLLTARFKWSRHSKVLLQKWPLAVPLLPLLDDAMEGYVAIEEQMLRINLRRCTEAAPLLMEKLQSIDQSDGNPTLIRRDQPQEGANSEISLRSLPSASFLGLVLAASESSDPLGELRVESVSPPPSISTDGTRATAVLSTCFATGSQQDLSRVANEIAQRDGHPGLLLSDLVNTSMILAAMLGQLLGSSPHAVLGRLAYQSSDTETSDGNVD